MPAPHEWNTLVFSPLRQGFKKVPITKLNFTERHVPYSDYTVRDIGGRSARHIADRIRITPADYINLESQLGDFADLYWDTILYPDAQLLALDVVEETEGDEWVLVDVDFGL